jgi:hypothetical protein
MMLLLLKIALIISAIPIGYWVGFVSGVKLAAPDDIAGTYLVYVTVPIAMLITVGLAVLFAIKF